MTPSGDVHKRVPSSLPTESSLSSGSKGKTGCGPLPCCLSCGTGSRSWSGDADARGRKQHLSYCTEMFEAQAGTWYPDLLATAEHLCSSCWAMGQVVKGKWERSGVSCPDPCTYTQGCAAQCLTVGSLGPGAEVAGRALICFICFKHECVWCGRFIADFQLPM